MANNDLNFIVTSLENKDIKANYGLIPNLGKYRMTACTKCFKLTNPLIAKENKIRITFDHQIVSTESDMNLFAKDLNMNPVLDPFAVVLEVKFNGFLLDYIRDLISNAQKSELSVSKYMLARQASYKYNT